MIKNRRFGDQLGLTYIAAVAWCFYLVSVSADCRVCLRHTLHIAGPWKHALLSSIDNHWIPLSLQFRFNPRSWLSL